MNRIAILGAGKMGSWFARHLSRRYRIGLFDPDREKLENVQSITPFSSPEALSDFAPQLLINAVPLQHTIPAYESVREYLPTDCVISDIASIKGELPNYYREGRFRFASVHPMFGPRFADLDHLKGEHAILIGESDPEALAFFAEIFKDLGIRVHECSFEQHDEWMSYSLTLPFASSIVFSACLEEGTVPGTTFARHLDISEKLLREDAYLLTEVLFNPHSLIQLEKICHRLEFLKHVIRARDYEESYRFLDQLRKRVQDNCQKDPD